MSRYFDISRLMMAFMTLKRIVLQNKEKTLFNFAILFLLLSLGYLVSLIKRQI